MTRRIVLAGGTGYLGRHLTPRLVARGDDVVVLTRGAGGHADGVRYVTWDPAERGAWVGELDGAHAIVHLTGERVDRRPTRANLDRLVRSRVEPVRAVGRAIRSVATPPAVWVQLGTLAVYGEGGDAPLDESVPPSGVGPPQMVQVALAWERAFAEASAAVDRSVLLRFGIAIGGADDPTITVLSRLARFGLGGTIGGGGQWISWIALSDALRVLELAVHGDLEGTYHVCSPEPVDNREMMATLRDLTGAPFGLPAPAPLVRIGAPLMGSDPALALTGRRGVPQRLLDAGFTFETPRFADAAADALSRAYDIP